MAIHINLELRSGQHSHNAVAVLMMNWLSKLSRNYAPGACTGRTRRRAPAAGQHVRYFQSCHIACRGRCLASADGPSSAEIATTLEGVFAAARGTDIEQQAESQRIVECLRRMVLISKIWPVYAWDPSPRSSPSWSRPRPRWTS